MINSRKLEDLLPKVKAMAESFIEECDKQGIDVLITSTYRDNESQNALYNQGRTTPGKIVTNAKAGQSYHNYRCALDFVPLVNGKPNWNDTTLFTKCGVIAEACGFIWSGRWKGKLRELAHVQFTNGLKLADLQKGAKIV